MTRFLCIASDLYRRLDASFAQMKACKNDMKGSALLRLLIPVVHHEGGLYAARHAAFLFAIFDDASVCCHWTRVFGPIAGAIAASKSARQSDALIVDARQLGFLTPATGGASHRVYRGQGFSSIAEFARMPVKWRGSAILSEPTDANLARAMWSRGIELPQRDAA
ncbi:hypothetical protein [Caballeronia glathei]|nr:hypothetical protein [Caballeronia glathei]